MSTSEKLVTIYVRKSRLKDDDELEISRQIELLTDYADTHNMDYKLFHEEGSSEDWNREKFQKMLKELESGIYDGVLVTDQDRLSRDSVDLGLFKRFCVKEGLILYTLDRSYDFSNDDDNFITGVQAEMDSHFMRVMKRKMLRGRIQALKSGVYFGLAPFGYNKSPVKPKILIKNPDESKIVEMIFDMYVHQKKSQREIADKVNLLGYKTREGNSFTSLSITVILKNVAYKGMLLYELQNAEPIVKEHAHEAIVSERLFEDAQIIRAERRTHPEDVKLSSYLLSRLIKCPKCKTTLSFCMKYTSKASKKALDRNKREPFILDCYASLGIKRKREVKKRCINMGGKLERIEEIFLQKLQKHLVNLDVEIELLVEEGDNMFKDVQTQIDQIDKRLEQLVAQKSRVKEGFQAGIYDADETKERLRKIESDDIILKRKREETMELNSVSEIEKKVKVKEKIEMILSNEGDDVDISEANKILREIIDYVHYFKTGRDTKFKKQPIMMEIVYK